MSVQLPLPALVTLLLAAVRAAAWLVLCPPFSNRAVPARLKALLAVGIALPVTPGLTGQLPALTPPAIVVSAVEQAAVGAALGFVTALLFAAVQAAGDLIDLFGGFSVAFAFDPLSYSGNSVFGRFYNLLAVTLVFVTDAHLLILRGFTRSYETLPLDSTLSLDSLDRVLTTGLVQLFLSALQIAGPLLVVLFCADVALGLLTRVAPAIQPFSLGFPAKIMLTLALAGVAVLLLPQAVRGIVDTAVRTAAEVAGAGR